ncbi:MAG: hypothetical protein WCP03_04825 [Candidatus Saccharibacteria bacterium]
MTQILIIIGCQLLFVTSDIIGRHYMKSGGFVWQNFITWWFLAYQAIRFIATIGQLYILSQLELGKTMTMFTALGLITVNLAGYLFFGEVYSLAVYIGIMFAITAFIIIALAR